jgi:biotin operon repressor
MATRRTSKQATTKAPAKIDTRVIDKQVRNSERDAERRNPRARSRSAAARIGQAGATAGAADGAVVHDKPEQTRSRSEPTSGHIDLGAGSGSGAEQPPASTKRAKLIAMLERREGASVAEIGQRLGWLPHTVWAAITGLRKAGRAVTRNKEADVY